MNNSNIEILTQTIPRLFDLCDTIRQAADYAGKAPASLSAMRENISAGITAVETSARRLSPNQALAATELNELAAMDGAQLFQFVMEWYTQTMGPYLVKQFRHCRGISLQWRRRWGMK